MFRTAHAHRRVSRGVIGLVAVCIVACGLGGFSGGNQVVALQSFPFKSPAEDVWLADDGGEDGGNSGTQSIYLPGHIFMIPTSYYSGNTVFLQARREDSSGTTHLRIRTYDDGDLTEAMTILGNGDVGIGQVFPVSRLHIQGPRISDAIGSTASGVLRVRDDSGKTLVLDGNQIESVTDRVFINHRTDHDIILAAGGGNVGIGTGNPESTLTVSGTIETTEGGIRFPDGTIQATAAVDIAGALQDAGNEATGPASVVAGGGWNRASGEYSTVSGGRANLAEGYASTVSGGQGNDATGSYSAVYGGAQSTASGDYAVVVGGNHNQADGFASFAAGHMSAAKHRGSFVWGDTSGFGLFESTSDDQFSVRATGGIRFVTGIDPNGGTTAGVRLDPGASSWDVLSDRSLKTGIAELDSQEVLAKLAGIPVTEWSLVAQGSSVRHVGPMAQDFHAAFGLGTSDRYINSSDLDGIALISIQALHEISEETNARMAGLEALIEEQASVIDALQAEIDDLRQLIANGCDN